MARPRLRPASPRHWRRKARRSPLLDADPNAAAYRWATKTYSGPALTAYAEADKDVLADLLPGLADRHALLLVDTAGFRQPGRDALHAGADAVLVPVTPGAADIIEAGRTMTFIEGLARSARRPLPARVIMNRVRRGTTLSRHALEQIDALDLPRLQTALSEAVGFGEMGFSGSLPATGATAATEIAALLTELRELGWLPLIQVYEHT